MTDYSTPKILEFIRAGLDKAFPTKARGDALEDLVCSLLEELSGVKTKGNVVD